ncbi:hypothetical protein [Loigolactobacillus backii]|uniref:hypothetical protein n=1 Tax=Loigolactobacillus backii TaxID=375175 RepID=UPI0022FD6F13|nr:hypothetical protein [Loigolactobacillus backii]MDA5391263.1 hypothetical protein [Loigolactobacillus backii]
MQWFLIGRYDYQTAISMMDKSLPDTEMTNILTELIVTGNQQFTAYEQLANEFNTVLAIHKRDNKRAEALLKQVSKELKQIKQPTIKGFKYEEV